jgi:hypothetical protein
MYNNIIYRIRKTRAHDFARGEPAATVNGHPTDPKIYFKVENAAHGIRKPSAASRN